MRPLPNKAIRGEQLMGIIWDGLTCAEMLNDWAATARAALANAAKAYDWPRVFELISGTGNSPTRVAREGNRCSRPCTKRPTPVRVLKLFNA